MSRNLDLDRKLEEISKNPQATSVQIDEAVDKANTVFYDHRHEQHELAAVRITKAIKELDQGHIVRPATEEEGEGGIDFVIQPYGRKVIILMKIFTCYGDLNAHEEPSGGAIIHVNGGLDEDDDGKIGRFLEQQINRRLT